MAELTAQQALPTEIVLIIVDSLVPEDSKAIYSPDDPVTKTLLALTLVCRATSSRASQLLLKSCSFINSEGKAIAFLQRLRSLSHQQSANAFYPTRLYLNPLPPLASGISGPEPASHHHVSVAMAVRDALMILAPVLKTMIMDMPFRQLDPGSDTGGVRSILHEGFEALVNLEEFVCLHDELFSFPQERMPLRPGLFIDSWGKLRRLSIYNKWVNFGTGSLFERLIRHPSLEIIMFTQALRNMGLTEREFMQEVGNSIIKDEGRPTIDDASLQPRKSTFTMVLADYTANAPYFESDIQGWYRHGRPTTFRLLYLDIKDLAGADDYDESVNCFSFHPAEVCQAWMKEKALDGGLWDEAISPV